MLSSFIEIQGKSLKKRNNALYNTLETLNRDEPGFLKDLELAYKRSLNAEYILIYSDQMKTSIEFRDLTPKQPHLRIDKIYIESSASTYTNFCTCAHYTEHYQSKEGHETSIRVYFNAIGTILYVIAKNDNGPLELTKTENAEFLMRAKSANKILKKLIEKQSDIYLEKHNLVIDAEEKLSSMTKEISEHPLEKFKEAAEKLITYIKERDLYQDSHNNSMIERLTKLIKKITEEKQKTAIRKAENEDNIEQKETEKTRASNASLPSESVPYPAHFETAPPSREKPPKKPTAHNLEDVGKQIKLKTLEQELDRLLPDVRKHDPRSIIKANQIQLDIMIECSSPWIKAKKAKDKSVLRVEAKLKEIPNLTTALLRAFDNLEAENIGLYLDEGFDLPYHNILSLIQSTFKTDEKKTQAIANVLDILYLKSNVYRTLISISSGFLFASTSDKKGESSFIMQLILREHYLILDTLIKHGWSLDVFGLICNGQQFPLLRSILSFGTIIPESIVLKLLNHGLDPTNDTVKAVDLSGKNIPAADYKIYKKYNLKPLSIPPKKNVDFNFIHKNTPLLDLAYSANYWKVFQKLLATTSFMSQLNTFGHLTNMKQITFRPILNASLTGTYIVNTHKQRDALTQIIVSQGNTDCILGGNRLAVIYYPGNEDENPLQYLKVLIQEMRSKIFKMPRIEINAMLDFFIKKISEEHNYVKSVEIQRSASFLLSELGMLTELEFKKHVKISYYVIHKLTLQKQQNAAYVLSSKLLNEIRESSYALSFENSLTLKKLDDFVSEYHGLIPTPFKMPKTHSSPAHSNQTVLYQSGHTAEFNRFDVDTSTQNPTSLRRRSI